MRYEMGTRDSSVTDKIYNILEHRTQGVSLQSLARMLSLKIGTVKKNLVRMEKELVVIRTIHHGTYVYKLTDADTVLIARKRADGDWDIR